MRTIPIVAWIANAAACLAGPYGAVTERTRVVGCSRQAAYHQARKVRDAVAGRDPRGSSRGRLLEEIGRLRREIDELLDWIDRAVEVAPQRRRRFAVTAAAMGLSTSQIRGLLALILGDSAAPSRSAVGRWTAAAGEAAGRALARLDAASRGLILVGCLDEIFFHRRPVLVGVEPASMAWFLGQRADSLRGETWARALRDLPALRHVIADAGKPLQAGIALARAERAAGGGGPPASTLDAFHTVHQARKALGVAWRRAEGAYEDYEAALAKVDRARRKGTPAHPEAGRARAARRRAEASLAEYDAMEATWGEVACALEVFRPDGRLNDRAWAEARVAPRLPTLTGRAWTPVVNHLRDPSSFTSLDLLHAELEALPIAAGLREALVRLWWLRRQRPRGAGPVVGAGHVAHLVQRVYCSKLDEGWAKWYLVIAAILRGVVRASSAVECMNSVLRMHQSRHRTMTPGMLDLKRLYWNARRFRGGKRKGKCPYEHLGLDLPSYDFWDLIKEDFDDVLADAKADAARKARSRFIARVAAA
jgi:hypothetical protein